MEAPAAPNPADILPKATYYQVVHTLRAILPPPATNTPEDAARCDFSTIAHVASLLPANAEEVHVAAVCVAADAQALECLRLARQYPDDPALVLKCTARSTSMMREARQWRALLERTQIARQKRDAQAAAQTEARALALMADGLASSPPPQVQPTTSSPIAEAERYALHHRKRAMLIRRLGRVPEKLNIGSVPPEVVRAIVTGDTPILRALDAEKPRRLAA